MDNLISDILSQNKMAWDNIEFIIVDVPLQPTPYEIRREYIKSLKLPARARIADVVNCKGADHLSQVLKASPDPIFLHEPKSFYEYGRSTSLLKAQVLFLLWFLLTVD
jgi:hypothetical protein